MRDDSRLARARERFLAAEPIEPGQVRETILASWRRSREWHVAVDRIVLSFVRDPDLDTPLTRTALPVLQNLRGSLQGEPVSVILTDAHGVALARLTADRDLERHLDRVQLAPGFSYAEEFAGTNGIGTALESGRAAHVFGHEHYAGQLVDLACAAVPIRHPVSGLTVGAVGLTCWFRGAGRLLHELVPFFLARLNPRGPPTCSPEAMHLLLRSNWPGNTEQLWQVLRQAARHRRTGTIHPDDLPPECWSVSRRLLSPLESLERDAIVQSLLDHHGNKAKGAGSLGMSRATIYRKIHEYGIITPAS